MLLIFFRKKIELNEITPHTRPSTHTHMFQNLMIVVGVIDDSGCYKECIRKKNFSHTRNNFARKIAEKKSAELNE